MTPTKTHYTYATIEEGRAAAQFAADEWRKIYRIRKPGHEQALVDADRKRLAIRQAVINQFGTPNPKYPDCQSCLEFSVFGGPRHEARARCRSGKHPHCCCDICF